MLLTVKTRQWHSPRNSSLFNRASGQPTKPAVTMAPILPSSESKSKLRVFQYDHASRADDEEPKAEDIEAEKENTSNLCNASKSTAAQILPRTQTMSRKSAVKENRECPQTPVGRLALAELIASGEDLNQQRFDLTPVERVLWNQSPRGSNPTASTISHKGRKRANSSSPSSSAHNETSNHFSTVKPSLDLQSLDKCLKTPKADPANDLWSRYSITNERKSPTERSGQPFAHLLDSSSPQTPAAYLRVKESGGLRRSISCTTEWPTSITKRRKLDHSRAHEEAEMAFTSEKSTHSEHTKSKRSRVSLLVDRLHDELAASRRASCNDVGGPSSSSPLPEKGRISRIALSNTLRSSQTDENDRSSITSEVRDCEVVSTTPQLVQHLKANAGLEHQKCMESDSSSDFGDDDLDIEMLRAVDASVEEDSSTAMLEATQLLDLPSGSRLTDGRPQESPIVTTPRPPECHGARSNIANIDSILKVSGKSSSEAAQVKSPQATTASRYDEFDEDDNDVSAAELEDAVAMYDLQPQTITLEGYQPSLSDGLPNGHNRVSAAANIGSGAYEFVPGDVEAAVIDLSSDDEFGGALDFEQIIAECTEVKQLPQVASQPHSSVCIKYFGQSR